MNFFDFIRDKIYVVVIGMFSIILSSIILNSLKINLYTIFFINFIYGGSIFIILGIEFFQKYKFYSNLNESMEKLDKKYMISEIVKEPHFCEGKILYDVLVNSNKSMNDEIIEYKNYNLEYKEYIERWIHEIKTPIAAAKLIIENNKNKITEEINDEIYEINNLLEQVLFYARSSVLEKDYFIKKVSLKDIVFSSLKKNSKLLIKNKFNINFKNLDFHIFTDTKWIDFIIGQIIQNSVKYRKENPVLMLEGEERDGGIALFITDNGVGITKKDIGRVFEKGFTGETGRRECSSTGIGLYLCKKLCDKLGVGIKIYSEFGMSTTLELIFPRGSMTMIA